MLKIWLFQFLLWQRKYNKENEFISFILIFIFMQVYKARIMMEESYTTHSRMKL